MQVWWDTYWGAAIDIMVRILTAESSDIHSWTLSGSRCAALVSYHLLIRKDRMDWTVRQYVMYLAQIWIHGYSPGSARKRSLQLNHMNCINVNRRMLHGLALVYSKLSVDAFGSSSVEDTNDNGISYLFMGLDSVGLISLPVIQRVWGRLRVFLAHIGQCWNIQCVQTSRTHMVKSIRSLVQCVKLMVVCIGLHIVHNYVLANSNRITAIVVVRERFCKLLETISCFVLMPT